MAGHRYWRLLGVTAHPSHTGSDGMGLNSLQWQDGDHTPLTGYTLAASANDTSGSWNLSEADDADGSNVGWYTGNTGFAGQWISADFGADVDAQFVRFCCLNSYGWSIGRVIKVQHSDDNSTWTDHITLAGLNGQNGEARVYRIGAAPTGLTAHRAWRVKSDSVGNAGRGCTVAAEIEFLADEFGTSLTYGLTANALLCSSEGYGNRTGAFDTDYSTLWHASCGTGGNDYIGWDSGASSGSWLAVGRFSWRARGDDGAYSNQDSIKIGGLEWTDDDPAGTPTWHRDYTCTAQTGWTAYERRVPAIYVPPDNDAGGHRYWRVYQYRNSGSQTGIAELEFAKTAGGPNLVALVPSGVASADGHYSGYDAFKAFDGVTNNGSNEWGVSGGGNGEHWLQYDFGAGSAFWFDEVRVAPMSDTAATPRIFEVQYSDDGTTWTTHFICINDAAHTYGSFAVFTRPTPGPTHRYLGFYQTKSRGEVEFSGGVGNKLDMVCRELQMAATVGGSNIATGGTPHWYPTSDAVTNAFDGNFSTECYNGGTGCKRCSMWYDFGSPTAIAEIRFTGGDSTNENYKRSPSEGAFIYSDDGRAWLVGNTFSGVDYSDVSHGTATGSIVADPILGPVQQPAGERFVLVT